MQQTLKAQETREELFDLILASINEMPELLRQVFVLSRYHGKTPAEIANQVRVSEKDIASLINTAYTLFYRSLRRSLTQAHV
ncbi:MAG TPA: sigma factor-like helix-turn-helix DNA-binding protein [Acidobacteriota bacterium]|jgi:DNA-directed RNA polymerase specialized sigma24 family protein